MPPKLTIFCMNWIKNRWIPKSRNHRKDIRWSSYDRIRQCLENHWRIIGHEI